MGHFPSLCEFTRGYYALLLNLLAISPLYPQYISKFCRLNSPSCSSIPLCLFHKHHIPNLWLSKPSKPYIFADQIPIFLCKTSCFINITEPSNLAPSGIASAVCSCCFRRRACGPFGPCPPSTKSTASATWKLCLGKPGKMVRG